MLMLEAKKNCRRLLGWLIGVRESTNIHTYIHIKTHTYRRDI
ncbi:unnamed protein product [Arabidopsis halleri]